jgi:hypothetical protein
MAIGNNREFLVAWGELRETFARKLALKYLGLNIDDAAIRSYDLSKSLTTVFNEMRRRNFVETTIFRARRRMQKFRKQDPK